MKQKTFIFKEPANLSLGGKDLKIKVEYDHRPRHITCNGISMYESRADGHSFHLRNGNLEIIVINCFEAKNEITGIQIRVIEFENGEISDVSEYCVSKYK